MRGRSLPFQFLALILIPTALLLILFAGGNHFLHQRAMRDLVGERDLRAARAAAAAIGEQLDHRAAAVRSLSDRLALTEEPATVLGDLEHYALDFQGGVAYLDGRGRVVATTAPAPVWLDAVADGSLGGGPGGARFLLPAGYDDLLLAAVDTAEGRRTVGAFYPASLARQVLLDVFDTPGAARALLLDGDGNVIFQSQAPLLGSPLDAQRRARIAAEQQGTQYVTMEGREFVLAYAPVMPLGWTLVIEEPWQAVAGPLLENTALAPLVLVPVLLFAVLGVWIGLRQIVQPLQRLEKQATALAWGDYGAVEEPVGGIAEIERLQRELAHMAGKVRQAQQSLRGYLGAVTTGQEEERRRLARELHDDTIQSLIALRQQAQWLELTLADREAQPVLARMAALTEETIDNLRRLIRDLRPIYLEDLGLVPALEMLARDTGRLLQIPVEVHVRGAPRRLDANQELVLYRIAQEGLSNVARHAAARRVDLTLDFRGGGVALTVKDDGRGFAVPDTPAEMGAVGHYGLLGIQERAELIGARLEIASARGTGTTLRVTLEEAAGEGPGGPVSAGGGLLR